MVKRGPRNSTSLDDKSLENSVAVIFTLGWDTWTTMEVLYGRELHTKDGTITKHTFLSTRQPKNVFGCTCTVAVTSGMTCIHAVILVFKTYNFTDGELREVLGCEALEARDFIHPYWFRELHAFQGIVDEVPWVRSHVKEDG